MQALLARTGEAPTEAELDSEIYELAEAAGYEILHTFYQRRRHADPRYYVGKGKLEQIKIAIHGKSDKDEEVVEGDEDEEGGSEGTAIPLCLDDEEDEEILALDIDPAEELTVIMDGQLTPRQTQLIEHALKKPVLDKVMLILRIFERRATTKEAMLQISYAHWQYLLPRVKTLVGEMLVSERPGFHGAGARADQVIAKDVRSTIARIRKDLAKLAETGDRKGRETEALGLPTIAIVGFYSSGKSTLYNALTGGSQSVGHEPFVTMGVKTGAAKIGSRQVLVTDSIGLTTLPPFVIESFKPMFRMISHSTLVVCCIEATKPTGSMLQQIKDTMDALELVSGDHTIENRLVVALTKCDLIPESRVHEICDLIPHATTPVSAKDGEIEDFVQTLKQQLDTRSRRVHFEGLSRSQLSKLHDTVGVEDIVYNETDGSVNLTALLLPSQSNVVSKIIGTPLEPASSDSD